MRRTAGTRGAATWAMLACGPVVLVLLLLCGHLAPAVAQNGVQPRITIADTITVQAPSQTPLAITVAPAASIPRNAFLRLRGLPPMAALSDGHSIAPGAWAVSLSALPTLKVTMPGSASGRLELTLALVSVDGAVLAEGKTTLIVGPLQPTTGTPSNATILRAAPSAPPAETKPAPPAAKQAPPMKAEDRDRAMRLLKRGQQLLEDASLSEARLLFEKAADLGLADAALMLAGTYDEPELARLGIRGVQPDNKEARRWYERAAQLGAAEAQQRLQRLGAK